MKNKKIIVIGGGFSSLAAACYLAHAGHEVVLLEKNEHMGGRARQWKHEGFVFDMGPTFYWMPDLMEAFFQDFGKSASDYYELLQLDPGYEIVFGKGDRLAVSADLSHVYEQYERIEPGSAAFLKRFLKKAGFNYRVAIDKVIYKPGRSVLELIHPETATRVFQFVESIQSYVRRNIKDARLRQALEFPVLFLGAKPSQTPAFYCFMNYADMVLGTWHIKGGMYQLIQAQMDLAVSLGVQLHTGQPVQKIVVEHNRVRGVETRDGRFWQADAVVSGADYHHTEQLLPERTRNYSESYWNSRVLAPSALLFYVGFDVKLPEVKHHTLFFDASFEAHAKCIYDRAEWPERPLFYASFPSVTDEGMAPAGKEAGIFLIPLAPGLNDSDEIRERYFKQILSRMEAVLGYEIRSHILFKRSYCVRDFMSDYHAYKGNAYGLSNILRQTAVFKPGIQNKRLSNLFYTGQLTVPGPGVPTALISGKIAATELLKQLNKS
ncbi:MAG: phytoene desaturase family protein [Bacteroidales bacterium]|nr:phytoene desaturase family protein [Bacteroidales bacterium]